MTKQTLADLDPIAANNSDVLGLSTLGSANANTFDDVVRALLALLSRFYSDIGGVVTVGGTGDAITITTPSTYQTLENGLLIGLRATAANTGAATINVDSLGAKAIRRLGDTALNANDIVNKGFYLLRYDTALNTAAGGWFLLNPSAPDVATAAQFRANTASKVLDTTGVYGAAAEVSVTVTTGGTTAWDQSSGLNFRFNLGAGNTTIGQPSSTINGKMGRFVVKQDSTGSRTVSWHVDFEFASGTPPTLSTAANAEDVFYYDQMAANRTLITGPVRAVA